MLAKSPGVVTATVAAAAGAYTVVEFTAAWHRRWLGVAIKISIALLECQALNDHIQRLRPFIVFPQKGEHTVKLFLLMSVSRLP